MRTPIIPSLNFFLLAMITFAVSACADMAATPATGQPRVPTVVMTKERQQSLTPDMALQLLKEGNERFTSGKMLDRDLPYKVKITGFEGQFPFVAVVSCMDSRAAPTQLFDAGVGDMFGIRIAGNIVDEDVLGSLEYATKVAGAKIVVILGHSHCGAVKGACDDAKLGNLTQLLQKIRPAVAMTPDTHGSDRSSKNHEFVDAVAETNVRNAVKSISDNSPILREMIEKGQIKVVGAMLDVENGKVAFLQ